MNDRVLTGLLAILEEWYSEPPHSAWPQHEAEEITFSRWAIEEMVNQVWDHPWTLASETIEHFANRLEIYEATSKTDIQERIFKIAAETAWTLLEWVREAER